MVQACICLECGSIEWREYGTYTRYHQSSIAGITEEHMEYEYDDEMCVLCSPNRLNYFELDLLSEQERTLFFYYNNERRLLMFLRLSKSIPLLINVVIDEIEIEEKIAILEASSKESG